MYTRKPTKSTQEAHKYTQKKGFCENLIFLPIATYKIDCHKLPLDHHSLNNKHRQISDRTPCPKKNWKVKRRKLHLSMPS